MGVWAAIATGGAAAGLLAGGLLVEFLSWPWIFFVNVPVGIAAGLAALRWVPESRDAGHKTYDIPGAVTVTAGLIALVYGIVSTEQNGWASPETLGFLALAVVLLTAFVVIERRSPEPLVRLSIFGVRTLRAANVVMLLVASGLFAMFFFNTLYIQRVLELLAAPGWARVPALHGRHRHRRRALAADDEDARPAHDRRDRPDDRVGRHARPAHDRPGRLLPRGRPPDDDPALDRNGAYVRPGDAARDLAACRPTSPGSRRASSTPRSRSAAHSAWRCSRRSR